MLGILKRLHYANLGCKGVSMVFDGKTYYFVDAQLDGLDFHILFGVADVVGRTGDASTGDEET
jgi:hypothetical protein